jgi:hypothetical protein
VRIQFSNLNLINEVKAASGTLSFNFNFGSDGRASGNAVIIRRIGAPNSQLPAAP